MNLDEIHKRLENPGDGKYIHAGRNFSYQLAWATESNYEEAEKMKLLAIAAVKFNDWSGLVKYLYG